MINLFNVGIFYNPTTVNVWIILFVFAVFITYFVILKKMNMELKYKYLLLLIISCVVAHILMLLLGLVHK